MLFLFLILPISVFVPCLFSATINVLSICGEFAWLNHGIAVFDDDQTSCMGYFNTQDTNFNRCDDKGYLMFIRVLGATSIFTLGIQAAQMLLVLTDGHTLMRGGDSNAPLMHGYGGQGGYVASGFESGGQGVPATQQQQPLASQYAPPVVPAAGSAPQQGVGYQAM